MELSSNFKSKFKQTPSGDWKMKEDKIALGLLFVLGGGVISPLGWIMISDEGGLVEVIKTFDLTLILIPFVFFFGGCLSILFGISLFTKTETLTIRKDTGSIVSEKRWGFKSKTNEYPNDSVSLNIHPTSIHNPKGIDWQGFGLTLSYGNRVMMIARQKHESKLKEYALSLSDKIPNQNLEPIVTTPADKVEAQSTQAHV